MFLYRKKNALSPKLCKEFIKTFESSDEKKPGVMSTPHGIISDGPKRSTDITFNPNYLHNKVWGPILNKFIPILEIELSNYLNRHITAFEKLDAIEISPFFNMQRYNPGEAFYGWHCERAGLKHSDRVLVWMVYLNTLLDRGETEFYYQHHFESAEEGKLIIWPSDWMYLHRGVPSPTETKYILTGWFTYIKQNN